MNHLIAETNHSNSMSVYRTFATYAAERLPCIWMPNAAVVMAVSKHVRGVVFNPLENLLPEYGHVAS